MTEKLGIYKCEMCGNIVEVLTAGAGELVCCGQPMNGLVAKTSDQGREKHVPVIEQSGESIIVKVGDVAHPMEEKHYIEWIELVADGKSYRQFLKPGQKPEACFNLKAEVVWAREHCTVHGLWKGEVT
jgi:superoxide reductase